MNGSAYPNIAERVMPPKWPKSHSATTLVRRIPKVKRNAACPCGSGLKAKRCCFK